MNDSTQRHYHHQRRRHSIVALVHLCVIVGSIVLILAEYYPKWKLKKASGKAEKQDVSNSSQGHMCSGNHEGFLNEIKFLTLERDHDREVFTNVMNSREEFFRAGAAMAAEIIRLQPALATNDRIQYISWDAFKALSSEEYRRVRLLNHRPSTNSAIVTHYEK